MALLSLSFITPLGFEASLFHNLIFISSEPIISSKFTWQNIVPVHRVCNRIHNLHPLWMVNITTSSLIISKYSYCLIEGSRNKLSSCWWIFYISDCSNMIFMNIFCSVHLPYIKSVEIGIFTTNCNVNGFNRVERQAGAFIVQIYLLNWGFSS